MPTPPHCAHSNVTFVNASLRHKLPDFPCNWRGSDKSAYDCADIFALPECSLAYSMLALVAILAKARYEKIVRALPHSGTSPKPIVSALNRPVAVTVYTGVTTHMG